MVEEKRDTAILLSVHPKYAEAILNGSKTVEFRKSNIPRHVDQVVLYATSPVRKVVGHFAVSEIVTATPEENWKRFNGNGGITHDEFKEYYASADMSVALVIARAWRLSRRLGLHLVDGESRPPHSFRYLQPKTLKGILKRKVCV